MSAKDRDNESIALKKSLASMSPVQRLKYFFSYYTIHTILAVLALIIAIVTITRILNKKEPLLYIGMTNAAIGSILEKQLTEDFLDYAGYDPRKNEVVLYKDLYISNDPAQENHEYSYASQLKLMAAVNAEKMDLVIMNREAYDLLSGKGFLCDLTSLTGGPDSDLYSLLQPYLTQNQIIVSDNSIEVTLGESDERVTETKTSVNGINVSELTLFSNAGFQADVYLGIIANSPRTENALRYLEYLVRVKGTQQVTHFPKENESLAASP